MGKNIFVYVECKNGVARKSSYELLSMGKGIAERTSSRLVAVVVGSSTGPVAEEIKSYCDTVIVVEGADFAEYRYDCYVSALASLIEKYAPSMLFGSSTVTGKDLFPCLAARLGSAFVADAVGIEIEGDAVHIEKPLYGGKVLSWIACKGGGPVIATFRPNSFSVEKGELKGEIIIESVDVKKDERFEIIAAERAEKKAVDLQEADFIICGGRGLKDPDNFTVLEDIAEAMGGRVGASRAVVDSKWRDYDDQIGKSGKTVSPKLYIGSAVSGAIHHIMGMDTSKVIVAINKDETAPIFQYADYGIVDDVFTVLPALKSELIKIKAET